VWTCARLTTISTATNETQLFRLEETTMPKSFNYRLRHSFCLALVILWFLALRSFGQTQKLSGGVAFSGVQDGDYPLGPGDILTIAIGDSPELSGKYRIGQEGYVVLPGVPTPIRADGVSVRQLSTDIARALKEAQLLRDPIVSVYVEEYHSQTVTVLGAVNKPSVYPLPKLTTVLEVLSLAGGLTPTAGNTLTIVHRELQAKSGLSQTDHEPSCCNSSIKIDLAKLMQGNDPSLNIEVHSGDIVSVSAVPIIYVVGAVTKPGGYTVQDPSFGITALQALAMAAGLKSVAASSRSMIIRRTATGQERGKISVDLEKLMAGKLEDPLLQPNDILFVPESGTKRNLQNIGEIAEQTISGITIYGVGYRAAGLPTH
jgi:polysaccharide export outer membrane protein